MKTIFFDFDGTLTRKSPNIWKSIWKSCNYDTSKESYFTELYHRFINGNITHQEWCDLTCEKFIQANFSKRMLDNLADNIKTINGLDATLKTLKANGYCLHIISGNIKQVIEKVLGDKVQYFDTINANKMQFDKYGKVVYIEGTNYDFEGKARFIEEFKEKTNSSAKDLIFVGNGDNDEWAHLSGCKTICINPDNTDFSNKTKWHIYQPNVTNLTQILPFLDEQFESKTDNSVQKF